LEGIVNNIQNFFVDGGIWMWPIAFLGALAMGISLYRMCFLMFIYNCNGKSLSNQVTKLIISGQMDRAIKFCNSRATSILGRVLKTGVRFHGQGENVIGAALDEGALKEVPKTTKYLNFLGVIANLATLLGLLGTILGLIQAFETVATAPADQKAALLGSSISIAMNTTAFGLMVSIPTLFVHSILVGIAEKISDEVDMYSVSLLNILTKSGVPTQDNRSSGGGVGGGGSHFSGKGPHTVTSVGARPPRIRRSG